ncbi:MAG: amino acid ABC transporter permease [Clostridia bacterium]|nr:amino acid ABC transporter permease [Clostridia bacterium]MBP3559254.1 amino acid ABC transporter permease [Clostridia bacterium]
MDQALLTEVFTRLADGFVTTLEIFALTLLIALPLGLIMSFGSMSKFLPLKYAVRFLVWVVRGSPLMIQLILVFYGPGLLGQWALDLVANGNTNAVIIWLSNIGVMERFVAVIIAFSVNYACYFSEIYRGGIESIPKGQYEAGQVLGMTKTQVFFKVVLMQVVKRIIPPMSNEIITLVKDTSLARVIAVYELIWAGETFIKLKGIIWPLIATAIFYLAFSGLLTFVFGKIEKKLDYYKT